jgi:hypothetical protein
MDRVRNLKEQRAGGSNAKLINDIEEIKSILTQDPRPETGISKLTEIEVIVPKELATIATKIHGLTEEIELMEKFDKDLNKNMFEGVNEKELEQGPYAQEFAQNLNMQNYFVKKEV